MLAFHVHGRICICTNTFREPMRIFSPAHSIHYYELLGSNPVHFELQHNNSCTRHMTATSHTAFQLHASIMIAKQRPCTSTCTIEHTIWFSWERIQTKLNSNLSKHDSFFSFKWRRTVIFHVIFFEYFSIFPTNSLLIYSITLYFFLD